MELFLNLLWAAIATAILCAWRFAWTREDSQPRTQVAQWTSVCVALVLLFFAVSLTDDLNANLMLFDECGSARRYSTVGARHGAHSNESHLAQRAAPALRASLQWDEGRLEQQLELNVDGPRTDASHGSILCGRAPPEFPL